MNRIPAEVQNLKRAIRNQKPAQFNSAFVSQFVAFQIHNSETNSPTLKKFGNTFLLQAAVSQS